MVLVEFLRILIINEKCWNEEHQFYFDLGYDKQIIRYHIGSYWALLSGVVPKSKQEGFVSHLSDNKKFKKELIIEIGRAHV